MRLTLTLLLIASSSIAAATDLSSPEGLWQPMQNGRPQGLVRIFEQDGAYFGRIEPSSPSDDRSERCTRCTGDRKNQPIIGLIIMRNLRLKNGEYVGGDILDPRTGAVYGCKFRLTSGGQKLRMRGYLGFSLLGRSQTWMRVEGSEAGALLDTQGETTRSAR